VQALNADFCTGGVLKWLCGGPGTAFLYVRPDLGATLKPGLTGWFAHENAFAFEIGPNKYGEPPYRFMQGTSNVPGYHTAMPGLKIIAEAGVERIRAKSKKMTARLIELADQRGWKVNAPRDPEQRGGTVAIDMPNAQEVCQQLLRRDVLVDFRPRAGVRFSPHFYNTMEEIDHAIHTVDEILAGMGVAAR
jgi:kynureninase